MGKKIRIAVAVLAISGAAAVVTAGVSGAPRHSAPIHKVK